jgi:hypothetical protein
MIKSKMVKSQWLALFLLFAPSVALRGNAQLAPAHATPEPAAETNSSNATFCPGETCLYYAGDYNSTSFQGLGAAQDPHPDIDADPNGAVGTKQYMEWINVGYQGYDKTTFATVWQEPQPGGTPWDNNPNTTDCAGGAIHGDGMIIFDRLASRWVIGGHTSPPKGSTSYFYCIAVSSTDDLTNFTWYAYEFPLNSILGVNSNGIPYFPDWPKLATWWDAYYVGMDMLDLSKGYAISGTIYCAMDRTDMLNGAAAQPMQCFKDGPSLPYLKNSPIPADVEGSTAPPSGRDEYFLSIQNPPHDGKTTTTNTLNLWTFHVDWANPTNSTFSNSSVTVPTYTPGCFTAKKPTGAVCVPQPGVEKNGTHYLLYSGGDRLMPRLAYRNFGTYESFLISHSPKTGKGTSNQVGVGWYELRGNGSNNPPTLYQSGIFSPDPVIYRFFPSVAQDGNANVAMGYSVSDDKLDPGIRAIGWKLGSTQKKTELTIKNGAGSQETPSHYWGTYTSMTVDPVDDCTFWYVNEYLPSNQTGKEIIWQTEIANFQVSSSCEKKKSESGLANPLAKASSQTESK